ncbi:MAG: L,D-transpeptidase [Leptolyngbya foveolarum]|uniref:L,D-transpeptidase n=1 Tax=Leptolyngbya foveolarum TaxID=47253 RepID=A0A2W4W0I6_9CYAN|nr:MAG: L,D-transpeptidase [Leptolyngbya foveolarum]
MAASIAVPDEATATAEIDTAAEAVRVVLRLGDRKVFLYQGEQAIVSYPVAVGAAATPTPQGQFEVSKLVIEPIWQSPWTGEMHAPGPNSALGLRWIGFHTSESGSFGFHGTPTLDSIGKAVSNGCVRMRNEDIVALFSQVTIGTPVKVEP